MEPHQIIAILATFISFPIFFVIVWAVDRFKPKDWDEKHGFDDGWGYKWGKCGNWVRGISQDFVLAILPKRERMSECVSVSPFLLSALSVASFH